MTTPTPTPTLPALAAKLLPMIDGEWTTLHTLRAKCREEFGHPDILPRRGDRLLLAVRHLIATGVLEARGGDKGTFEVRRRVVKKCG